MCDLQGTQAGFVDVFDRVDGERVRSGAGERTARLWCWKNDRAVAEVAVLSGGRTLRNVTVSASALCGEAGELPSSAVKLSFIDEVRAFTGHAGWYANNPLGWMPHGERAYFPEVIGSGDPVTVEPDGFRTVWVSIDVPADCPTGLYHGELTVSYEDAVEPLLLSYTLEVLDAVLPDAGSYLFDVEYWSHPYNVAYYYGVEPFSDEHLKILRQHMTLYRALGGHAVTASIVEEAWGGQTYGFGHKVHYPSMIRWSRTANGEWRFDYTHFDRWVRLNRSIGIADKIVCYSMMPWKNEIRYYDEKKRRMRRMRADPSNKEGYRQIWLPFLRAFVDHLDEMGWFDFTYIGFDERRHMETAFDLVSSVKNREGRTLKLSAAFNDIAHNMPILERLDSVSVGLQEVRTYLPEFRTLTRAAWERGRGATMYTATEHVPNSFTRSFPVESYWTILFAGAQHATGFLRWAYDAWVADPLTDSTHWSFPAGDCFLVYPSRRDAACPESRLSLRLAMLDEGVRDVNRLYLMRETAPALAEEVEALFATVKGEREDSYAFDTMKRTDPWGRTAKWLTKQGKEDMIRDMRALRSKIYELSKKYSASVGGRSE